ncbi:MAG: TIGR00366 family protein [Myxococcota bacterium]
MLARIGYRLERLFRAVTPDPFVLAIFLTAFVGAVALIWTDFDGVQVLDAWHGGLWRLLGFGMQMCLVLVTGHALAASPPVRRLLKSVADRPQSGPVACAWVAAVTVGLGLINWGLGLVGGALLARDVSASCRRRGVPAHGPALAAAGYAGMMTWHGGFSGSAPLKVTRTADLIELLGPELGAKLAVIPSTATLLGPLNLFVSGGLWILLPLMAWASAPRGEGDPLPLAGDGAQEDPSSKGWTDGVAVGALLFVPLGILVVRMFARDGVSRLDPNAVNLVMLFLGLALHGRPSRYLAAVRDAVPGCGGIILQFPLYAGIMGIMGGTGLAAAMAAWAAEGGEDGLLVGTFLSAGFVNLLVPSGGGQWAIQGPIALEAGLGLGVAPSSIVMAVAYGDQWTNMLQPFWALPLLGVTGARVGPMLGYTSLFLVAGGLWMGLGLILFG